MSSETVNANSRCVKSFPGTESSAEPVTHTQTEEELTMVLVKPLKEGPVRKEAPVEIGHYHGVAGPAASVLPEAWSG